MLVYTFLPVVMLCTCKTLTASWNSKRQCQYGVCCEIWMALRSKGFAESTWFWKKETDHYTGHLILNHFGEADAFTCTPLDIVELRKTYLLQFSRFSSAKRPIKCVTCWQYSSERRLAASNLTSSNWETWETVKVASQIIQQKCRNNFHIMFVSESNYKLALIICNSDILQKKFNSCVV